MSIMMERDNYMSMLEMERLDIQRSSAASKLKKGKISGLVFSQLSK